MSEKKRFHRGEDVIVRWRSTSGVITELPGRVVRMDGHTVRVRINDRDETIALANVRKATDAEWLSQPVSAPVAPAPPPARPDQRMPKATKAVRSPKRTELSATLGELVMAKIQSPPHFGSPPVERDPNEIGAVVRRERVANGLSVKTAAKMLRIQESELEAIESGGQVPDDGIVLRFADVLNCPLDPLSKALDYTRERVREDEARKEQAMELGRKTEEAKAKKLAEAEALKAEKQRTQEGARSAPVSRTISDLPKRTLEDFAEHLMDMVPVPIDRTRSKQWWTCARILFELEGAN